MKINFLKTGVLEIKVPEDIKEKGIEKIKEYLEIKISETSDKELQNSLSEHVDCMFDEDPEIQCIEDKGEQIFQTKLWKELTQNPKKRRRV